jgi:very-short-patch-repair endonuclease
MIRIAGTYEQISTVGETVNAFVPAPLPPRDPPLKMDAELSELLRRTEAAVKKLRLAGATVPSLDWLLYSFVRKEAVVSSQIEGTQVTLVDLLMYEAGGKAEAVDNEDVKQVCNYVDALNYARKQMRRKKGSRSRSHVWRPEAMPASSTIITVPASAGWAPLLFVRWLDPLRETMVERVKRRTDSGLEREWLEHWERNNYYRLPSDAQIFIESCETRPDFSSQRSQTVIYVDGPYHEFPERHQRDRTQTDCMKDLGYTVIRFADKQDWDSKFVQSPHIFGKECTAGCHRSSA